MKKCEILIYEKKEKKKEWRSPIKLSDENNAQCRKKVGFAQPVVSYSKAYWFVFSKQLWLLSALGAFFQFGNAIYNGQIFFSFFSFLGQHIKATKKKFEQFACSNCWNTRLHLLTSAVTDMKATSIRVIYVSVGWRI